MDENVNGGFNRAIFGGAAARETAPVTGERYTYGVVCRALEPSLARRVIMVHMAKSFRERFLGLMGVRSVPLGCGLLFEHCRSIHMMFMRVPLDVVWLSAPYSDGGRAVVAVSRALAPWRLAFAPSKDAIAALEMRAGTAPAVGTRLHIGRD